MQMFLRLSELCKCCLLLAALSALNANGAINMSQQIDFGNMVFVAGTCDMDFNTGTLTNIGAKDICTQTTGSVGMFEITATPNTIVTVTVGIHANDGDGIQFVPEGELTSSAGTTTVIPNNGVTIDSGATGQIDLVLGGRLVFLSDVTPSTTFLKDFQIEYVE